MKVIDDEEFERLVENFEPETIKIQNMHIHLEESIRINMKWQSFYFENCTFTGKRIDFFIFNKKENPGQSLQFIDCSISNDLFIKDCILSTVAFRNVKILSTNFQITSSQIKSISITGTPNNRNEIKSLVINNLIDITRNFDFKINNIDDLYINNCSFNKVIIIENTINKLNLEQLHCNSYFEFWKNIVKQPSFVNDSSFSEFIGKSSTYGTLLEFKRVIFKDIFRLDFVPEKPLSSLTFKECTFDKSAYFDGSIFHQIMISSSFFKDITSFNSTSVNIINLKSVHFDKIAFFNNFKVELKSRLDIDTIRIIKNQLSKTENKIDYIKYNALEQELLLKDATTETSEWILLWMNKTSNYFGNNWLKGVRFTLIVSAFGFTILLIVNKFLNNSDYNYLIGFNSDFPIAPFQEVLREWLKFTFSFDLRSYQNYESHGVLLFIFFFLRFLSDMGCIKLL